MARRRARAVAWLAAGSTLLVLVVGFFLHIAHRDSKTLQHGEPRSGHVVGLIQPHAWDPLDGGRLVVSYDAGGRNRTATIWIDNELSDYALGQSLELFVRGPHVRTEREPNDPAPLGLAAVGVGLLGVGALVRGTVLCRAPRERMPWSHEELGPDASASQRWRARSDAAGDRLWSWLWWWGVPLLAAIVLPFVLLDLGPAYRAHAGSGTPGTFIARNEDCDRNGCSYTGDFRSDDGTVSRTDVLMASGSSIHDVGNQSRALDTGDRADVYPPGGGSDWLILTGFLIGIVGVTLAWAVSLVRRRR